MDGPSGKGAAAPAAAGTEDDAARAPAVAVTYGLVDLLIKARSVLILIGVLLG